MEHEITTFRQDLMCEFNSLDTTRLAQKCGAVLEQNELPPLAPGQKYGIVYYYLPERTDRVKIGNLFKNQFFIAGWSEENTGSEEAELISLIPGEYLLDQSGNRIDTRYQAYLVSYDPNGNAEQVKVCSAFSRSLFWMIRVDGARLTTVHRAEAKNNTLANVPSLNLVQINQQIERISQIFADCFEIEDLPELPEDEQYGILYYYIPSASFFSLSDLFILKSYEADARNASLGERHLVSVPNRVSDTLRGPFDIPINTFSTVYLAVYSPNNFNQQIRIVRVFDKEKTYALRILGTKLVKILLPSPPQQIPDFDENTETSAENTLSLPRIVPLPPLPDDSYLYALVCRFARNDTRMFFYHTIEQNASSAQLINWTIASADTKTIQFYENDASDPVAPGAILNTIKYLYVVRIKPAVLLNGQSVPSVIDPVLKIRSINKQSYQRVEIQDTSMLIYSDEKNGFIQMGEPSTPQEPSFAEGETLLIVNNNAIRAETYRKSDFAPAKNSTIYRFGILTKLLRDPNTDEICGGLLNDDLYFSLSTVPEVVRNTIMTHKKRMLLIYTFKNNRILINRLFPDRDWNEVNIPWKTGIVQSSAVTATELRIEIITEDETGSSCSIPHYLTPSTDAYINTLGRSGQLNGKQVYLKEIHCLAPSENSKPLIRIAALLHSASEKAIIQYSQPSDQFFAFRYNPTTLRPGTIFVPVYGVEQLLRKAENQPVDITFSPVKQKPSELYAFLPGEKEQENDIVRVWKADSASNSVQPVQALFQDQGRLVETPMGQLLLSAARDTQIYRQLSQYLSSLISGEAVSETRLENSIQHVINSENWEDNAVSAALFMNAEFKSYIMTNNSLDQAPKTPDAFLRRALRARVARASQSGDYQAGAISAALLPILASARGPKQTMRDLYIYLVPYFYSGWAAYGPISETISRKLPGKSAENIIISEFERRYQELLSRQLDVEDSSMENRAHRLVPQLLALDSCSLTYLKDRHGSKFPQRLIIALLKVLEPENAVIDSAVEVSRLFTCIETRRQQFIEQRERIFNMLDSAISENNSISKVVSDIEKLNFFSNFIENLGEDDRHNLLSLIRICSDSIVLSDESPSENLLKLKQANNEILHFRNRLFANPTTVTAGLLFRNNIDVLDLICEELSYSIREICIQPATVPKFSICPNCETLQPGQERITFNLSNGSPGSKNCRELYNIEISLQIKQPGASSEEHPPKQSRVIATLLSGEMHCVSFQLSNAALPKLQLEVECTVNFQYLETAQFVSSKHCCQFDNRRGRIAKTFFFSVEESTVQKSQLKNPYEDWENKTMQPDSGMFFGRTTEERIALDYLMGEERSGLIPGRTLIIYGQKRCGKSSFLLKIKKEIQKQSNTIVLFFDDFYKAVCESDPNNIVQFTNRFYTKLLKNMLDQLHSQSQELQRLVADYKEQVKQIDNNSRLRLSEKREEKASMFTSFMDEFMRVDGGRTRVVLITDEFTRLCVPIKEYFPQFSSVLGFIRSFSEAYGFIQIIVGHHSMLQILSDLRLTNQTVATAKLLPIAALDEEDAREMIQAPLRQNWRFNPYETTSGKIAVNKLMDLSGNYPNYLISLCNRMCQYYKTMSELQIDQFHVTDMLDQLFRENPGDGFFLALFDPILQEDSDSSVEKNEIDSYLRRLAQKTYAAPHRCSRDMLFGANPRIIDVLCRRSVLHPEGGTVRINVGLFREYVHRRYKERV